MSAYESAHSGISQYRPDDSWSPYVEMNASYQLSDSWNASLSGRYTRFGSEIKDSPMVDKDGRFSVWTGVSYSF